MEHDVLRHLGHFLHGGGHTFFQPFLQKADVPVADKGVEVFQLPWGGCLLYTSFGLVDIELACGEERVGRLVRLAKKQGVAVVLSKHDFEKTPSAREITATLLRMKDLGADLPKYAVMPQTPGDVLELLSATWQASSQAGPVITMAMGELGKVTRAAGGVFGCAMTFGAGESASAPGQIDAENLRAILEDLQPYNLSLIHISTPR